MPSSALRAAPAAAAAAAPAAAARAVVALVLVAVVLAVLVLGLVLVVAPRLGVERGGDQRVVLGAQVELVVERGRSSLARRSAASSPCSRLKASMSLTDDLELVRDPGVGPALADPCPDLVELRFQGATCHAARNTSNGPHLRRTLSNRCLHVTRDVTCESTGGDGRRHMLVLTRSPTRAS